jgi:hypothetical protein
MLKKLLLPVLAVAGIAATADPALAWIAPIPIPVPVGPGYYYSAPPPPPGYWYWHHYHHYHPYYGGY